MVRPQKQIDWDMVENMAEAHSPGTEIAQIFNLHPDTFYRKVQEEFGIGFTEWIQSRKSYGKSRLRAKQYNEALTGNTQLLLRLGEVILDQDKKEVDRPSESITVAISEIKDLNAPLPVQSESSDVSGESDLTS